MWRLSADSIGKISAPTPFGQQGKVIFICLVAVAKEVVWWPRLKELKTNAFLFDLPLIPFFRRPSEKESEGWERSADF